MLISPSAPAEPVLPFRFVGGHSALDLVNTVDWTAAGLAHDRLAGYDRLLLWGVESGAISARHSRSLRAAARARPAAAARALARVHRARSALHHLATALARSDSTSSALAGFNPLLEDAARRLRLGTSTPHRLGRTWDGMGAVLESPLWPVIWAAADLFASDKASRIRVCAGADCGWVYLDTSRAGRRRWCEMATCGTTAKNRRRAARVRRRPA